MMARLKTWWATLRGADRVAEEPTTVEGERGIPSVNRARSLQSRVSATLAVAFASITGVGLLTWYYTQALTRGERVHRAAASATEKRAQNESVVPPLAITSRPTYLSLEAAEVDRSASVDPPAVERWLGPPPPLHEPAMTRGREATVTPRASARDRARERQLAGVAFVTERTARTGSGERRTGLGDASVSDSFAIPAGLSEAMPSAAVQTDASSSLEQLLTPTRVSAVQARLLPNVRLLLGKGTTIDCTLESAIDTSVAGFTSCVTATDTFSADGATVLLPRGTRLIGESRGEVRRGASRVFVLWTEARIGRVVVPLDSPGTDELGRAGLPGHVQRHFFERFGAAILLSVIDGAVQGYVQSQSSGDGAIVVNPSGSNQIVTEVLRGTMNIPPTLVKPQGVRIQIRVARDVDFRGVYALRRVQTSAP